MFGRAKRETEVNKESGERRGGSEPLVAFAGVFGYSARIVKKNRQVPGTESLAPNA